jgi:hypothetical protein
LQDVARVLDNRKTEASDRAPTLYPAGDDVKSANRFGGTPHENLQRMVHTFHCRVTTAPTNSEWLSPSMLQKLDQQPGRLTLSTIAHQAKVSELEL